METKILQLGTGDKDGHLTLQELRVNDFFWTDKGEPLNSILALPDDELVIRKNGPYIEVFRRTRA